MRRKLGQVDFRIVTWDREKNWPIADRRVPSNNPRNHCGTHFGSSSFLISKVASVGQCRLWYVQTNPTTNHDCVLNKDLYHAIENTANAVLTPSWAARLSGALIVLVTVFSMAWYLKKYQKFVYWENTSDWWHILVYNLRPLCNKHRPLTWCKQKCL